MPGEGQHKPIESTVLVGDERSDAHLLQRVAAHDAAALRTLFDRHAAALLRYATALGRDRSLAEDAVQETFVSVWQHAAGFRAESSPRAWLFTIARNAVHRRFRRKIDAHTDVAIDDLGVEAGWGDPAAQRSVLDRIESDDAVRHALAQLDDDDREVLALVDVEGLSTDEAAVSLSLSLAALKSRLHRARLRFVAALRKEDSL